MDARRRNPGLGIGVVALALIIGYVTLLRPWQRHWGATGAEVAGSLPGDSIIARPVHVTTRAITIAAPPDLVWPWLVQMGYRRGGLYSYDRLDRWFGVLDRPSADSILPALQGLRAGDSIPIGAGPGWPVALLRPNRTFLLHIRQGDVDVTWVFELLPRGTDSTRLVTRVRASAALTLGRRIQLTVLDPAEFLMVRRMLLGLKARGERLFHQRFTLPSDRFH